MVRVPRWAVWRRREGGCLGKGWCGFYDRQGRRDEKEDVSIKNDVNDTQRIKEMKKRISR